MDAIATSAFGRLESWQAMLDGQAEVFAEMLPGASVAIVPRAGSGIQPGRRAAALKAAAGGEMLRWEVVAGGVRADLVPFRGLGDAGVDLLFVAEDEALARLREDIGAGTLTLMKRQLRAGDMMFFVMRNKHELQEAGYEEFLDSLGLAFLGACR
ncbi:MAG TPA: hypothetical protein PKC23_06610 [Candidatus Desulfobacillus sp.]|nr:hypothetical protein [Candidatus Desulfobacillus sp.]